MDGSDEERSDGAVFPKARTIYIKITNSINSVALIVVFVSLTAIGGTSIKVTLPAALFTLQIVIVYLAGTLLGIVVVYKVSCIFVRGISRACRRYGIIS